MEEIQKRDYEGESNAYRVSISIRFNQTVVIGYNFEPWTTDESDREKQMELFTVKEGDWVTKGEKIANFVACAEDAHIHFDISVNHQQTCPKTFFDEEGYNEVMILLQLHWPDAEIMSAIFKSPMRII